MVTARAKTTVVTRLSADCPSHSRADVKCRDLTAIIDEPIERDGTNLGISPTETVLAALIGCTNVIAHKCAARLGVDIGHARITLAAEFDRRGVMLMEEIHQPFTVIKLRVEVDGSATQAELDEVAREVAKYCPVSKLYRAAGTQIEETWVARESA